MDMICSTLSARPRAKSTLPRVSGQIQALCIIICICVFSCIPHRQVAHDVGRAQKCLERALVINPLNASAGILLAEIQAVYLGEDGPDRTEVLCRGLVLSAPDCTWARLLLVALQLQSDAQDLDESKLSLQRLIRRTPREWRVWELLAGIYFKQKRRTAALKAFDKALELHHQVRMTSAPINPACLID